MTTQEGNKPDYKAIVSAAIGEKPSLAAIVPELRLNSIEEEIKRRTISDMITYGECSPYISLKSMLKDHTISQADFDKYEKLYLTVI